MKCVNQNCSLCITTCQAQQGTLLKPGEKTLNCNLSSEIDYAEGMIEERGFDISSILVAGSLNCVYKRQKLVVLCLNASAAPITIRVGTA